MTPSGKTTRSKRRSKRQRGGDYVGTPQLVLSGSPMSRLGFGPTNPGRVTVRGVVEVFNGNASIALAYQGFTAWCAQARSVLTPFEYFRIVDMDLSMKIAGGTASANSIVYNLTNSCANAADGGGVAILNDDFAAIASAATDIHLRPPQSYWTQGSRKWYRAIDAAGGFPAAEDIIAGSSSYFGSGGLTGATVIGWLVAEMTMEFHTLL